MTGKERVLIYMKDLKGRWVLITGASRGIGRLSPSSRGTRILLRNIKGDIT